jgi:hypothetical protein
LADPTMHDYMTVSRVAWGPLMFEAARCARDMGVLEVLKAGPLTPREVAEKAKVSYYAARVLLEACAAMELAAFEDDKYRITNAGELMLGDPMTKANMNFVHDVCYQGAFHLKESLEKGEPVGLKVFGNWPTVYAGLTQLPPHVQQSWFGFDHFYSDPMFRFALAAIEKRGPKSILDVGGNTGKFAVQAAKKTPVTILDHPAQLELARQNAEKNGVKIATQAFDLLDHSKPFPRPFDAVWMSQFLDCFPERDIVKLMQRGKAALSADGRLYVLESFWDRQPHAVARYNVQATSLYFSCIANGTSRMYAATDFIECGKEAGLILEEDKKLGPWHTLMVFKAG